MLHETITLQRGFMQRCCIVAAAALHRVTPPKGHRDQVSVPSVVRSAGSSSSRTRGSPRGKQSVRPAVDDGTDRILFPSPGSVGAGFR